MLIMGENACDGNRIGSIVMNANPFTLGHRYLIEQALQQCDHLHLFIVGEDASQFSYTERFEMIKQGIFDLSNITLHSGSDYIISRATFPNYFLKDQLITDESYFEIDLKLFRLHIAQALGITHRFVGTELNCPVTAEYNRQMHYWLMDAEMNAPKINVIEIPRKQQATTLFLLLQYESIWLKKLDSTRRACAYDYVKLFTKVRSFLNTFLFINIRKENL